MRRRRPPVLVAFLVALGVAALLAPVAAAQVDEDADGDLAARLTVTAMPRILGPGAADPDAETFPGDLDLRVLVENTGDVALENLRLFVEVYESARFRSQLHQALDGGEPGRVLALRHDDFAAVRGGGSLAPGDVAGVEISMPAQALGWSNPAGQRGVYPVRISILRGTEALDRVTTAVVFLDERVAAPLQTVLTWPIDDAPWPRAGGVYPAEAGRTIRPGGRLANLVGAVEAVPEATPLLALGAHLLEDLEDRAGGFTEQSSFDGERHHRDVEPEDPEAVASGEFLARIRALVEASPDPPVAGAYADADLVALVESLPSLESEAVGAVTRGRQRLGAVLGTQPDPTAFWGHAPLSPGVLEILADAGGVEILLVPFDQVAFPADLDSYPDLPPPQQTLTTSRGRRLLALVPDPYVDRVLRSPPSAHGPVVASQRLLAETAVFWTERPNRPGRGLVLLPPPNWDPDPRMAHQLLEGLVAAPWIELASPEAYLAVTSDPARPAQLVPRTSNGLSPALAEALLSARRELAAIQQALPADSDGVIEGRSIEQLDRQLLLAPSIWLRGPTQGFELAADVQAAIDAAFGDVVVATGAQITLTSDTGTIPITIQRRSGGPLAVRVEVHSTGRLDWSAGQSREIVLEPGSVQTLSFPVRAQATGSYGVRVSVTDPTGTRLLAEAIIPVRSTAISRPALIGTGVVVLLLLVAGVLRRRPRRAQLAVVEPPEVGRDRVGDR